MRRHTVQFLALLSVVGGAFTPTVAGERVQYPIDTPLYTLRGPEASTVSLIQTDIEIEYIGDYLGLDEDRSKSALRLLGHVDFAESILLIVNGGVVEGAMLRVDSIYEEDGVLHVVIVTADPPAQYRDSDFASPAAGQYTPSLVTVLPRFQGLLIVHAFPGEWASSGDLRGVQLLVTSGNEEATKEGSDNNTNDDPSDANGTD
jgi:hypothetical protein